MEKCDEGRRRDAELREREDNLRRAVDTGKFEYFKKAVEEDRGHFVRLPATLPSVTSNIYCLAVRKN